jgi:putative hydrolase of the HAD superfamily
LTDALVFDLDDTLYPERQYAESGLREVARRLDFLSGDTGTREFLLGELERGRRGDLIDAAVNRLRLAPSMVPELVNLYRSHSPVLQLFPGVKDLLLSLRYHGVALGLLTDGPSISQRRKIDALRLSLYFDAVVVNDELGHAAWKPSPDGYRLIEGVLKGRKAGMPHSGYWYIGDNPKKDFLAPRALGWRTIRLAHPARLNPQVPESEAEEAEFVVDSIPKLAALLSKELGVEAGA